MALLNINLHSKVLVLKTNVSIIMPEKYDDKNPLKVLWLLHGLSNDNNSWYRNTNVERYVQDKNICVIMPSVDRSFYTDMAYGNRYYTYLTEELPAIFKSMFKLSDKREDNYVVGLSMGGYGAFKIALNQPERFAAAASLSGAVDLKAGYETMGAEDEEFLYMTNMIFGSYEKFVGSKNDLVSMAEKNKDNPNLPRLYMCCGTEDFLYNMNLGYKEHLDKIGVPFTYEQDEGFEHTWDYWDMKIQRVIEWMGL